MYQINELDLWRQHREDLIREAERGRLVNRLKASRPAATARLRTALFGRGPALVEAAGGLRAGEGRCA